VHEVVARVVVARPRHELYAFWRNFDSLSSVWTMKDAAGNTTQWEMLVTDAAEDPPVQSRNDLTRFKESMEGRPTLLD
jgi:uncharacterized membrane protein